VSLLNTLFVASSLAVDSCVAALARGLASGKPRARDALIVGGVFGVAQGLMPLAGALGGRAASELFTRVDHWIAFGLLAALGVKSLLDAARRGGSVATSAPGAATLVIAALATSVDAAAAGFGFALVGESVAPLAWFTGAITACGSAACYLAGKSLAPRHRRAGLAAAGVVLLAIAFNVLREHWDHA
jgi:putative Mn2+ efflux pump MntP